MATKKRVILYVDDDADDQLMVHEVLTALTPATQIVTAMNGLDALRYLHAAKVDRHLPSLIIMDINMPLMDGKEAVTRIRKDEQLAGIPIVLFTTSSSVLDQRFCEQYSIPFVTKPINQQELYAVIENMLLLATSDVE